MDLLKTAHKKIILTFLFAIFIPSIIVGYISFNVFYKYRQSVEKLLNSALWSSGENAIETIENTLIEYEKRVLEEANILDLIQDEKVEASNRNWISLAKKYQGKLFIMDSDYQIISPLSGSKNVFEYSRLRETPANDYQKQIKIAEYLEFVEKDYAQAISQYKKSESVAVSLEQKSRSQEGRGRCLMVSKRFEEAKQIYHQLANQFSYVYNNAGHPYGIVATLQLFELAQQNNELIKGFELLFKLYEKINNGEWLINRAAYNFFTTEIEITFTSKQNLDAVQDILSSFRSLQQKPKVYKNILDFTALLEKRIIPKIKEMLDLFPMNYKTNTGRVLAMNNEEPYLVSYMILPNFKDDRTY